MADGYIVGIYVLYISNIKLKSLELYFYPSNQ